MEPTMLEIYRYLTVGPLKEKDRVAAWLDASPDTAGPFLAGALRQLSEPVVSEESAVSETALLAALESRAPLAPQHAVAWRELLTTARGRRFAADVIAYESQAGLVSKAQALAIAARARAKLAARRITEMLKNMYRVSFGTPDSVGHWPLVLQRVPKTQVDHAVGRRAPPPRPGDSVREVQFSFDDGVMFTVALSQPRNHRGIGVSLRHAVHHEDREMRRASLNGRPMRLRSGMAVTTLAVPPRRMEFAAAGANGRLFHFGLDIARPGSRRPSGSGCAARPRRARGKAGSR